jgi:hypothetical protein
VESWLLQRIFITNLFFLESSLKLKRAAMNDVGEGGGVSFEKKMQLYYGGA